jgi:hypothetical protein
MATATAWKGCTKERRWLTAHSVQLPEVNEGPGGQPPGLSCLWGKRSGRYNRCLMIVEVESSENCEASVFARFKEAGPARSVAQVRLYDRNPAGEWYEVTGWSDHPETPVCPAYARLVEDSGSGLAHLVYGGIYGLRFRSGAIEEPWSLTNSNQWGETHLLLSSERDLRFAP